MTTTDLEGVTAAFTMAFTALIDHVSALTIQVNNMQNNNLNQGDRLGE